MSAASGEPEVQRYDMGWNADAHDDIVPCEFGTFVRYADYLTLAQQRDAAVRERAECVAREQRWLARLAACEGERNHFRAVLDWIDDNVGLKEQYDSKYSAPTSTFFGVVEGFHGSLEDAANEYLDGHARTVRRTPPQDAATTRGEG